MPTTFVKNSGDDVAIAINVAPAMSLGILRAETVNSLVITQHLIQRPIGVLPRKSMRLLEW